MATITRRRGAVVAVALVLLAACGSDPQARQAGPTTTTTIDPAGRGWIGGEPDWSGGAGAPGESAASGGGDATTAYDRESGTAVPPVDGAGLRAGSVDDNEDFDGYMAYLDRLRTMGIDLRDMDPTGRIVVTVTGSDGRPAAGAAVTVRQGDRDLATVRTTADGTVRVLPALYGGSVTDPVEVAVGDVTATAEPGGTAALTLDGPGGIDGAAPVDVLFLLDVTGSMGDEVDRLKTSVDSISARIDALESNPDVRFAMTLYRDEGDAFVTSTFDFTSDVDAFRAALADVQAGGGGDYPEAMEEGLAEALTAPAWRDPATTVQLAFLVADAPPHVDRDVPATYVDSIRDAVGRGIKVFPVASSESDDQAEAVFRQVAQATGARFVFLSYGAGGAATGDNTDIDATDYEELSLDDLVVRLVTEELAHLGGGGGGGGTTTTTTVPQSTTTTTPPGQ